MKKSILSLIFTLGIIASYAQTVTSGVALRVNDTTTYQAQQVIRHSQGYSDIYWNNQATTPHFDIWNGSSYDHIFDFNAGGSSTINWGDIGGTLSNQTDLQSALDLKGDLHRAITTKTANHVLEAADDGTTILMNVASSNTVTIPSGVFATGTEITVHQIGAGQTTFVLSGVTATPTAGTGVLTLSGGGFAVVKFTGSSTCIIYNGSPALQVTSGTYTPTLTNSANLGASTARLCGYTRVGDRVTVTGQLDIDPTTTATLTTLGISLPVASNFTTVYQAGGAASAIAVADASAGIQADATNDRVTLQYVCTDITNHAMTFTFTYTVL